jgi:hypothetical protein
MSEDVCDKVRELGWQALPSDKYLMGSQFTMANNVREPVREPVGDDLWGKLEWHISTKNYGANNPTLWDGCEVAALPSKDRHEFLAALQTVDPPTRRFSGGKQDQNRRELNFDYYDFVQGETWQKTDWDLFCETLWRTRKVTDNDWDFHCLDEFNGFTYLRLDSDLRNAGVKECGVGIASIGRTFKSIISTAPIVSILLGPKSFDGRSLATYGSHHKSWHFLRTYVPDKAPNPGQPASNSTDAGSSTVPASSNKRPGSASIRTRRLPKVQKFEEFFEAL